MSGMLLVLLQLRQMMSWSKPEACTFCDLLSIVLDLGRARPHSSLRVHTQGMGAVINNDKYKREEDETLERDRAGT